MRITSWNCGRKKRIQIFPALEALKPDFAILQEVQQPEDASANELWIGPRKDQGLSVISRCGAPIRVAPEFSPALQFALPVEVGGDHPFQILAVWMGRAPVHYVPNLVAILDHYRGFMARGPTIVVGDFNANPGFDKNHPRFLFSSITAKFLELGFCSGYHTHTGEAHGAESQPTYFHRYKEAQPFHIDYCFLPQAWQPAVRSVSIGTYAAFAGMSDHRPLTVEIA